MTTLQTHNDPIARTLARLGPSVVRPGTVFELMETDPHDDKAILRILGRCPVLSARVLGVVNSAAFGISRIIASLERAVGLLGPSRTRAIALAHGLRALTEQIGLPRDTIDALWANSLRKACAARRLAECIEPEHAPNAFSLAFVQDIGLPLLIAVDSGFYENQVLPRTGHAAWSEHETRRFGFDHAMVGQRLLAEWGASAQLQNAVLQHHATPFQDLSANVSALDLALFFASLLPHWHEEPGPGDVEWMQAIHARFLADAHPSPDEFLAQVDADAAQIRSQDRPIEPDQRFLQALCDEVSTNVVSLTSKLCQLERIVQQERQGIHDLKFQAYTDSLTGVLNRRGFTRLAERRLRLAATQNMGVCCMLCDLDDLKTINDTHGHEVGDQVLHELARAFRGRLGSGDLIGRIGGDEFAVLIVGVSRDEARTVAGQLVESIEGRVLRLKSGLRVPLRFSLGAIHCDQLTDCGRIDDLLNRADQAMYQRKRNGKHGMQFTWCDGQSNSSGTCDQPGHARRKRR